jgi:hypothetical protein
MELAAILPQHYTASGPRSRRLEIYFLSASCTYSVTMINFASIQKFPDWPPGARTANGTALCH